MPKRLTREERIWRAKNLPLDQAVIDHVIHDSEVTGAPLFTPDSLRKLSRLRPDMTTWIDPRIKRGER